MTWLLVGPILLLLASVAALLPYASFRLAARNSLRPEGGRSPRRTRRELHHLAPFLRDAVLAPLLVVVALQGAAFVTHYYVIPDTTLSDLFGEHHPEVSLHAPDLEAWDEAIEADHRDRAYETWRQAQGLAPRTSPSLGEVMAEHWPMHLVFVLLPLAYLAWFFRRRYFAEARRYHRGVVQRARRYALRGTSPPERLHLAP